MLSPENAEVLLDELEEALRQLEGATRDPEVVEEARRLLGALDELPGPPALLEEPVERVRAWAEVLLEDLPPERHPGPGSPLDVIEEALFELRELVHEEQKGLGT